MLRRGGRGLGYAREVTQAPYRTAGSREPSAPIPSITICRTCGVVAPTQGKTCATCNRPLAEVRVQVPSQAADLYWAAVRCSFTCNQCKFQAPLDMLDADGAVECAHCGLRQRFEVSQWGEALAFAHSVADLAGPNPEGRTPHPTIWIGSDNPHASAGVSTAYRQWRGNDPLEILAGPGHPVCGRCRVPLSAQVVAEGTVTTSCTGCGEQARYMLGAEQMQVYPGLVAAVAADHRADRPRAQAARTQAGIVAFKCPACGGPLSLTGTDKVQTCSYCKATCLVSTRQLMEAATGRSGGNIQPETWWILVRGPSPEREKLLSPDGAINVQEAAKAAGLQLKKVISFGGNTDTVKPEPGVYEAPEKGGKNWPQIALTVAIGVIVIVVGFFVTGKM